MSNDVNFYSLTPNRHIYVSPDGSDYGDHSAGQPYKTIQAAINEATPGTAVMVSAGTYVENVKLPSTGGAEPIWLISADGPQAAQIIAANNSISTITGLGTDNFIIKDFLISGGLNGIQFSQSGSNFTNMVKNVLIDGNVIQNTIQDGIKISQADNVTVSNNTIKNAGQEGIDFVAVHHATIEHNEVANTLGSSGAIGVKTGSNDILIANNYVHGSNADGLVVGGWSSFTYNGSGQLQFWRPGTSSYEVKNVVVADNVVTDVARRPINILGAQDADIRGNFFEGNPTYYATVHVGSGSPQSPTPIYSSNVNIHDNVMVSGMKLIHVEAGSSIVPPVHNTTGTLDDVSSLVDIAGPQVRPADHWWPAPTDGSDAVDAAYAVSLAMVASTAKVTIRGTDGGDYLTGTAGKDVIDGGRGTDTMVGGTDDDIYVVGGNRDVIVEKSGEGTDTARLWAKDYVLADNVEALVVLHTVGGTVAGNAIGNTIVGGAGAEVIVGGRGDDILKGAAGGDVFAFRRGDGVDTIVDFAAGDKVALSQYSFTSFADVQQALWQRGDDTVLELGGGERITFSGILKSSLQESQFLLDKASATSGTSQSGAIANTSSGTNAADVGAGTDANNAFNLGAGGDVMVGGKGDDHYYVYQSDDRVIEFAGQGTDTIYLYLDAYALDANVENISVKVATGATVTGNAMDNILKGGAGNDVLRGGTGADELSGSGGSDTFVFGSVAERGDMIKDFTIGADKLDLRELFDADPAASVGFHQTGTSLEVLVASDGQSPVVLATLQGVTASQLVLGLDVLI